jgi:hypothetical protein
VACLRTGPVRHVVSARSAKLANQCSPI